MAAAAAAGAINVAAICGSLRKASYNRGLVRAGITTIVELNLHMIDAESLFFFLIYLFSLAIEISKEIEGLNIEYVDISPLPLLNTDLEVDGTYPPEVEAFRQNILKADCILFASPEYKYSVTGMKPKPFLFEFIII